MSKIVLIKDAIKDEPYALVSYDSMEVKAFALTDEADEWSEWANQSCKTIDEIRDSLTYSLQTELPRPATEIELDGIKQFTTSERFIQIKSEINESKLEMVGSFSRQSRRFAVKTLKNSKLPDSPSSLPLTSFNAQSRQAIIEYKALSFRADNKFSATAFEAKGARALWDPDLGPSGGWRCPQGSQFGGYITDRFGRGCGGGVLRRVGRALVDAGRGIDKLGEARGARRLERAAERANKPGGGRAQRAVGGAANALERGAQRLVGEYKPGDGRRGRRGISASNVAPERKKEIDNRLMAIRAELDDLVDQPPTDDIQKRIAELTDENKKLRRERDGVMPKRISSVTPAPSKRRVVKPEAGRNERVQGTRPVKKPVTQNRRQGVLDRAAERLVGEYDPSEYKPGDKKRIKNRENRYAKVSDEALLNALNMNSPKPIKPGQNRNIEANKRQERLEVLQEMLNRGLDIPEQFKKEVKQYRLKPQRKKRGAKAGSRRSRAANALERAAQRVLAGDKNKKRRDRSRRKRAADALERGAQRILDGKKKPKQNYKPQSEIGMRGMRRDGDGLTPQDLQDLIDSDAGITGLAELRKKFKDFDDAQIDNFLDRLVKGREKLNNDDPKRLKIDRQILNLEMEKAARELARLKKGKKERDNQRARARGAVTAQSAFTPIRRPRPKKMKGDKIAWDDMDDQQKARMRNRAIAELDDLDASWRKRLGLNNNETLTDKMIRDYIKERENNKPGAFIGVLKANANDWGVLKDYANDLENGDILNNLGPKRRKTLVDDLNNASAPRRVNIPSLPRPKSTPSANKRNSLNTLEKKRLKDIRGRDFDNHDEALAEAERFANANMMSMVVFEQDGKFRLVEADDFNDFIDSLDDDSRAQRAIGSVRYFDRFGDESKVDLSESSRVKQSIKATINNEDIGGSLPDDRSRRNVRNRFPNNGLPEKAFWRDKDWKARTGGDDADKHERRFGRYFDSDGNINARGKLVNQQLEQERVDAAKPRFSKTRESLIPESSRGEASTYSFGRLRVFGEDDNKRVLWQDDDGILIADDIVNDENKRQDYVFFAKLQREKYANENFARDLGKQIDALLIDNNPEKRREVRDKIQNLANDKLLDIKRNVDFKIRAKAAGEYAVIQNMLNELDSHPDALDIAPPKNDVLDSLPKASVRRRDASLLKSTRFNLRKEQIVGMQDERNKEFKAHIDNQDLDNAGRMIRDLRDTVLRYEKLLENEKNEDERINLLARLVATRDQMHKFEEDLLFMRQSIERREARKLVNATTLTKPSSSSTQSPLNSVTARLAILGNNYQKRFGNRVRLAEVEGRAQALAKEKNDGFPIYIVKDKVSGDHLLLTQDDYFKVIADNKENFNNNYLMLKGVYAPASTVKPVTLNKKRKPDYAFPFFGIAKYFVMEFPGNDEDGANRFAQNAAIEFSRRHAIVKRKSDGRIFVVENDDFVAFKASIDLDTDDYEVIDNKSPWGLDTAGMPKLNDDKKFFIKAIVDNSGDGVFSMNNGREEARERAKKYAQELSNLNGRNHYVIEDGKNAIVLTSKQYFQLLEKFNDDEYGLKITLNPYKISAENLPQGAGRDGLVGPKKMDIDSEEYKDAVVEVHDKNGSLDNIPEALFAAVVFDENMVDENGLPLEDTSGNLINFEDIFSGFFQPDEDFKFENNRFIFTQKKDDGYRDPSYGGIWAVYKVQDKQTGEIWWIKSSAYGVHDALLEDVGMEGAAIFNFAAANDPKQIRISGEIPLEQNGRKVRWTAMRDINLWDAQPGQQQLSWVDANNGGGIDGDNVSLEDMANIFVMDYVLDNQDRHGGNFKVAVDSNGVQRLGIIDNGLMFGGRGYDMIGIDRDQQFTKAEINQIASEREAMSVEDYADGDGNILLTGWGLPSSFKNRLKNSQFARDEFNLQVKYAIETMRENIDRILDEQRIKGKGIKLSETEIAHLKAMKIVADARLQYLEANPNAFSEYLGVSGPTPSPINAPMSPIRRPKGFTGRQAGLPSGGGL